MGVIKTLVAQIVQVCYNTYVIEGLTLASTFGILHLSLRKSFERALTFTQITVKSFVQRVADAFRAPAFAPVAA